MTETIVSKIFSSANQDGDIVSSNTTRNGYEVWKAFDGNNTNSYFATPVNTTTAIITYEFRLPQVVNKYYITNAGNSGASAPKNWTFEGSNEGSNWTILDTRNDVQFGGNYVELSFEFNNNNSYKYYRLNVTANNGTTTLSITEIKMVKTNTNKFLISSNDKYYTMIPGGYTDNVIPKMTSNTAPEGIASVSGISGTSYPAWKAFDGLTGSTNGWQLNNSSGWLAYEFTEPTIINKYNLTTFDDGTASVLNRMPKTWYFQGSIDGSDNWVNLDNQPSQLDWSRLEVREFEFENNVAYKKYRIYILNNNGSSNTTIGEMQMFSLNKPILLEVEGIEEHFINYGINKGTQIDLNDIVDKYNSIVSTNIQLGSGKVFSKKITRDIIKAQIK